MFRLRPITMCAAHCRLIVIAAGAAALVVSALTHYSSKDGHIEPPNTGTQQTSATVFDIDGDGVNEFIITERTAAPSVVSYNWSGTGWTRTVLERDALRK